MLWAKIGFMVFAFLEAEIAGLIPTCSASCRENPKVLGIANSFAGGVFLAIAFMHILPEQIEGWAELAGDEAFPLPEILVFAGYTFILIIDKVLFDTHALFDHDHGDGDHHHDPATMKMEATIRQSFVR